MYSEGFACFPFSNIIKIGGIEQNKIKSNLEIKVIIIIVFNAIITTTLLFLSSDLSQHVVTDCKQAIDLLEEGIANRITAATHNHNASSRSHAIFTIQYTQVVSR